MFVQQISVFLENKPGRLFNLTNTLAKNGIDIFHIMLAEAKEYGVVRCITKDGGRALDVLKDAGFVVTTTDLVALGIDDRPGSLNEVLAFLASYGVQVEYLYSFSRNEGERAVIMLKITNPEPVLALMREKGLLNV